MRYLILLILFIGCQKKTTAPGSTAQTTPEVSTVCWYQMFNGNKTFYKCTTGQTEYNQVATYCATNQMNMTTKQSTNCNCQ